MPQKQPDQPLTPEELQRLQQAQQFLGAARLLRAPQRPQVLPKPFPRGERYVPGRWPHSYDLELVPEAARLPAEVREHYIALFGGIGFVSGVVLTQIAAAPYQGAGVAVDPNLTRPEDRPYGSALWNALTEEQQQAEIKRRADAARRQKLLDILGDAGAALDSAGTKGANTAFEIGTQIKGIKQKVPATALFDRMIISTANLGEEAAIRDLQESERAAIYANAAWLSIAMHVLDPTNVDPPAPSGSVVLSPSGAEGV